MASNTPPFPGPRGRKRAFKRYLPADAPIPSNVVRFPWREAQANLDEEVIAASRIRAANAARAALPELYQSPELALIISIYASLPAKRRALVVRAISGLAAARSDQGSEAPAVALELLDRLETRLLGPANRPPKR